jgi:hypothetical protein
MDASQLSKISADAHIDEPHDLWFERIDPSLRDRAPRRIPLVVSSHDHQRRARPPKGGDL